MAHTVSEVFVPSKVDLDTGEVHNSMHELHYFRYPQVQLLHDAGQRCIVLCCELDTNLHRCTAVLSAQLGS